MQRARHGHVLRPNEHAIIQLWEEAGCFVLITNTPAKGTGSLSARELLTIYKVQYTVENSFAFLKDPVFVNALFLEPPLRIAALGLVLVLPLVIRRLMERTMRANPAATKSEVTGWEKRQTSRPTSPRRYSTPILETPRTDTEQPRYSLSSKGPDREASMKNAQNAFELVRNVSLDMVKVSTSAPLAG